MTDEKRALLIVSDRSHVWQDYDAPNRKVRRWIGERAADEPEPDQGSFTGDPTEPTTYRSAMEDNNLCAVFDIRDPERARASIAALRTIRPEAAVIVITAHGEVQAPQIPLSRHLEWTDALRVDLELELIQLEVQRCVHSLREFAGDTAYLPILVHPDPDPDALASALAVRALLRREPDTTPIVTLGEMTRPENRRMAELLGMRVTVVTEAELKKLPCLIAVDHQPTTFADIATECIAVIDHHPIEQHVRYKFGDLRPTYGATATIMTEYLRVDDERRIDEPLATALLYGIKTDTDSLARGINPADVHAYAYLLAHADMPLLRKLERPSYKPESARAYGEALANLAIDGDLAVAFLGALPEDDTHILVEVADFCMALEEITWSVAAGRIGDQIVFTVRNLGGSEVVAGDLARELAGSEGSGGGHATMARARATLHGECKQLANAGIEDGTRELMKHVSAALQSLRANPQSSRPTRQARDRQVANR
ncbi:MAG TPA: DHH family phosphoesterase [Longimicrobiales bacterium]